MKRVLVASLTTVMTCLLVITPARADIRAPLGCYGCAIPYGARDTWYTGCWSSKSTKPRLEAKVEGRWKVYAKQGKAVRGYKRTGVGGDYTREQLVCPDPEFPFIMTYTFTVKDEGQIIQGGDVAGLGLLPMREVWKAEGKTRYRYMKVYVS